MPGGLVIKGRFSDYIEAGPCSRVRLDTADWLAAAAGFQSSQLILAELAGGTTVRVAVFRGSGHDKDLKAIDAPS